jgi:hypothetical protein
MQSNVTPMKQFSTKQIIQLSTAHLHPLEAKIINQVSVLSSVYGALVSVDSENVKYCKSLDLVSLAELLEYISHMNDVEYIYFDPDFEVMDCLKKYDW